MKWTHTSLLEIILQLKGKVMAEQQSQGPTAFGKPVGKIGATLWGTDPIYNQLPTRAGYQESAQMAALPLALGRLAFGFGAPSIAPAQREATRHFREEVMPGIMENFAGGGSQGALTRGIQGAGSDLQSKLAALQYEKQFELQKQQQEMIPKIMELGMSPSFQTHITNRPIQGLPKTASEVAAGLPSEALKQIQTRFPDFYNKIAPYLPGAQAPRKNPAGQSEQEQFEQGRDLQKLSRQAKLSPDIARAIRPEHVPMIKELLKRRRGSRELSDITDINDIELLYNYWQKNPSKRSKIGDFFKSLVGKKRK